MGKSCLGEQISRAAAKLGKGVRLHSYEMPAADLTLRSASADKSIVFEKLRKGEKLIQEDYDKFSNFVQQMDGWNLIIDEDVGATVEKIALRARRQKRKTGLDLLVIDHLHLIPIRSGNNNRAQALADITGAFKRLSRELKISIVLLAQLNRETAKGGGRRPNMADIRDSGGIEQDADTIILVHRPGYYDDNANPGEAELIVGKNRNGPTGTVAVGWNGQHVRFQDMPPVDWTPPKRYTAGVDDGDEYL